MSAAAFARLRELLRSAKPNNKPLLLPPASLRNLLEGTGELLFKMITLIAQAGLLAAANALLFMLLPLS